MTWILFSNQSFCRFILHLCLLSLNMKSEVTPAHTYMFPSPSDPEYWLDLIFRWASLGLPGQLMNSHDRNKGGGVRICC